MDLRLRLACSSKCEESEKVVASISCVESEQRIPGKVADAKSAPPLRDSISIFSGIQPRKNARRPK